MGPFFDEFERLFSDALEGRFGGSNWLSDRILWSVYQVENEVYVVADVPGGVDRSDIAIRCTGRTASLRVSHPYAGEWSVSLPSTVETEPNRTRYANGVLELVFEKVPTVPVE
ncbi:Hsp20/alpha crystallin family protein [Haloarchaeobius sp. TZWWS8]|uniref:Hsp20/alpha crystallin family protein n=1 Tax=Haloarchaeobius sp. TZWWS8 TaxID=3446121 RepID=UPI003EBF5969